MNKTFKYISAFFFIIIILATIASYFYWKSDNAVGPNLITAFVGVVLSALVTLVLLKGQTKDEEDKDKSIRIFQDKQRCYSDFISKLWACKCKDDFKNVEESMRSLIFVVNKDKLQNLAIHLKQAKKDCENFQLASKSYAEITKLLRDDLLKENIDNKQIVDVSKACYYESDEYEKFPNVISKDKTANEETSLEQKEEDPDEQFQSTEIQHIWERYENGNLQCWHFNAYDPLVQTEALKNGKNILSLIEYDEDWRTQRLQEVKEGDIVFLFNRGGAGYVGMYRAKGTVIINVKEEGYYLSDSHGGDERSISRDEAQKYDIYDAIEDGATSIASIYVEPFLVLEKETYNPIGTMRQTIVRPNEENVFELLKYFDEMNK